MEKSGLASSPLEGHVFDPMGFRGYVRCDTRVPLALLKQARASDSAMDTCLPPRRRQARVQQGAWLSDNVHQPGSLPMRTPLSHLSRGAPAGPCIGFGVVDET